MKKLFTLFAVLLASLTMQAQEKYRIAVFDPADKGAQLDEGTKIAIREIISNTVVNSGKYNIVERALLEKVFKEQKFSQSGAVDDSQMTEIGKLAGANKVIVSVATNMAGKLMLSVKLIDVKTASVERQNVKIFSLDEIVEVLEPMAAELIGVIQSGQGITYDADAERHREEQEYKENVNEEAKEIAIKGQEYYEAGYYAEAFDCFMKAAELGNVYGQFYVGLCYDNGKGVPENHYYAASWYRKAADQGLATAQYNLALLYENGNGVTQDYNVAAELYKKAAEQDISNAQYMLALLYENGKGVQKNIFTAVKWYRKAAQNGLAFAQHNLGYAYYYGEGVPQDYSKAVEWWRTAAEQGFANSQYALGVCYENGHGVPKDKKTAIEWWKKAEKNGSSAATEKLSENKGFLNSLFKK